MRSGSFDPVQTLRVSLLPVRTFGARKGLVACESGIVFIEVEHDGNIQKSEEEVERVVEIYTEMLGRNYTSSDGTTKPLALADFLFIAPYNAQVRALQRSLPEGARVGSVDRFQGQEAPVCILSLCSSFGEYGSRGLVFILDRNRINVAVPCSMSGNRRGRLPYRPIPGQLVGRDETNKLVL